jgi:hypothetical protein
MFPRDDQIKWQDEDAEDIPAFPEPGFAQESAVAARLIAERFPGTLPLLPLTQFLLAANDPTLPVAYKLMAAEKAASYIYPKPIDACLRFDLGPIETVAELAAAQARVMAAMANGQAPLPMGKALIECLALMARTLEVAHGGGDRTLHVVGLGAIPDLNTEPDPNADLPQAPLKAVG